MTVGNENMNGEAGVFANVSPDPSTSTEESPEGLRLDFRHASNHLSQKRPGYYLILLRNEIRHRSLRDKPTLTT